MLLRKKSRRCVPQPGQLELFDSAEPDTAIISTSPPAHSPLANNKRQLHIGSQILDYTFSRSKRRSIGFQINQDGLHVIAPQWVTLAEVENAIHTKQRWIFNKLNEFRQRMNRRLQPHMQWRDGATFPYLGHNVTLRLQTAQIATIQFDEATTILTVCLPALDNEQHSEQQLKDCVLSWLQLEAKRLFSKRLSLYAVKLGVSFTSFALSSATTQWGSCTADGKIRLNWRLMHFSLPLIDYVIAHELSHLREMNHSPRFWATVQSVFPEFETARKTLRDNAQETLPVF